MAESAPTNGVLPAPAEPGPPNHSTPDTEALKLSIQGLQRIYAFIIAVAFTTSLNRLFIDARTQAPNLTRLFTSEGLLFLAFLATVVPFFHGMNRHLDNIYALGRAPRTPQPGAILLDLCVFVIEASLLFLLAAAIADDAAFFRLCAYLLFIDIIWAIITRAITGSNIISWAFINSAATLLLVLLLVCRHRQLLPSALSLALLTGTVFARTVIDYCVNWKFYFPPADGAIS